jgi:hypothetical protein
MEEEVEHRDQEMLLLELIQQYPVLLEMVVVVPVVEEIVVWE